VALLHDLAAAAGPDRRVMVARELTKLHEELRTGTAAELADYYSGVPPRGELTIVVEGTGAPAAPPDRTADAIEEATALLADGLPRREVARRITETMGMSRNEAYRLVMGLP
jgi:16S rRNA (cytidine1402-2'-O)-methyltransferase